MSQRSSVSFVLFPTCGQCDPGRATHASPLPVCFRVSARSVPVFTVPVLASRLSTFYFSVPLLSSPKGLIVPVFTVPVFTVPVFTAPVFTAPVFTAPSVSPS
jgi:hypothetical protein